MTTFRAFVWFLEQILAIGGWLAIIVGLAVLWRISRVDRRRLWILVVLPALWILTGLLGGYYWVDWAHVPVQPSPWWITTALEFNLVLFFGTGLISIFYLKGARWFAAIYFAMNLYFMIAMSFLSGMAITGNWL